PRTPIPHADRSPTRSGLLGNSVHKPDDRRQSPVRPLHTSAGASNGRTFPPKGEARGSPSGSPAKQGNRGGSTPRSSAGGSEKAQSLTDREGKGASLLGGTGSASSPRPIRGN